MLPHVPIVDSWIFQDVPRPLRPGLADLAEERRYPSGTTIFSEGDPADHLYLLTEGEVELSYNLLSRAPLTLQIARVLPGDVFGWSALARNERLTADARAVEESVVHLIPARPLLERMDADPRLGYAIMTRLSQLIARRLRETRREMRWVQSSI